MTKDSDLSNDDKDLFRKTMRDVKPLQQKSKNVYKKPPPTITVRKNINIEPPKHIHFENKHERVDSEEIIFYIGNGISKKQLLNLKNSRERYTAKLDLHGLAPLDAEHNLSNFISKQYRANSKIVLVIHGKSGRDSSPPVIKNIVNSYLRQMPEVLAFYSAQPKDGGTGAVYVLLKSSNFNL